MCGIIGIIGNKDAMPLLLDGLKRLEYRGYDSAGIAMVGCDGKINRRRAKGKLINLEKTLNLDPISGLTGIGHTRWATHGAPTENNAHPHMTKKMALVHNGIIENYQELRDKLSKQGKKFTSQTDTEVVAHLIDSYLDKGLSPKDAVAKILPLLEGAFAFVMIFSGDENLMIGARRGSPLAIGYGDGEMYFGSDALALAPLSRKICYLEEGDWAVLSRDTAEIYDMDFKPQQRKIVETAISGAMIGKGNFRHFMLKEIYEQPTVIGDSLSSVFNPANQTITMPPLPIDLKSISKITICACGTSYYAGMTAKYWLETIANIPVEVDFASEFRYRRPPMEKGGLTIIISQSGESKDTLEALRYCKSQGQYILSIVNVPESTIDRESDAILLTHAGPEIGVASTKAYTTQLTMLACFTIAVAKEKGHLSDDGERILAGALSEVSGRIAEILNDNQHIAEVAKILADARDVLYLGRGTSFPTALEGALKLKEISYIHAEGYAAGEMKHGPIALIDELVPIVVVAPMDELFDKTASNVQEAIARGGKVIFISCKDGIARMKSQATPVATIELPQVNPFVAPILYALPVQLLAYHCAVIKGTDVDQPRNLAKSVTVE